MLVLWTFSLIFLAATSDGVETVHTIAWWRSRRRKKGAPGAAP
jgi:hypothetical protein